ncbi:hypothetical protein PRK78_000007 [Emydomyces testavorans]|uniref:Uncharacterized protein n=1 Tax=Emydomyces testavorans TaxID=2070801 RepID=A0AAF0D9W4_9EURO|nr:hypothetical protein PRK78_000007 [Emydomyces testavorans]
MATPATAAALDPSPIDVVIIGNGPSALLLSYILHGNIPIYDPQTPHPDPILHEKLKGTPQLLDLDIDRFTEHFEASRFPYSTQALPVNSLFDSIVRPNADTDDTEKNTCVQWRHSPEKAVSHVVLGSAPRPGGQWTECPNGTSWNIQSLSYAGMLSLPGYSFQTYHREHFGSELAPFTRPSRREIADYFATYPAAVGISDAIKSAVAVGNISRTTDGFYIASHSLKCRHLVLASGTLTSPKPIRPLLQPLLTIGPLATAPDSVAARPPLLVIGSGFSAADIIISASEEQKIIHIFQWEPDEKPSPLKSCHQQAYPEYAGIYRLMKRSASRQQTQTPWFRPTSLTPFLASREWTRIYEGLPNTLVTAVEVQDERAVVSLRLQDGTVLRRQVSGLAHAVGRQGSLGYLDESLRKEILSGEDQTTGVVSASTLRAAASADLEVASNVFVVGSLTGDSLIRFAYGGCVYVAGKLITRAINSNSRLKTGDNQGRLTHATYEFKSLMNDRPHERSRDALSYQFPRFIWAKGKSWWNFLFS